MRKSMGIVSGQKFQLLAYQNRIELIPIQTTKILKGFLKEIDTDLKRDKDRI